MDRVTPEYVRTCVEKHWTPEKLAQLKAWIAGNPDASRADLEAKVESINPSIAPKLGPYNKAVWNSFVPGSAADAHKRYGD